ncbi:hypothetical protein [Deinococcus sp.]|uniref:hypothetical protein n=1 Tax=Deinococcus sp. TaxID=47478 RepID=UPI003C7AFC16
MRKPISRQLHGLADYGYVAVMAVAPELFGFRHVRSASALCRVLAGTVLASTLLTRAEWGLIRVIPFRAHLTLDRLLSAGVLASPWLLGFASHPSARVTLLTAGGFGLLAGQLTRPEEMQEDHS